MNYIEALKNYVKEIRSVISEMQSATIDAYIRRFPEIDYIKALEQHPKGLNDFIGFFLDQESFSKLNRIYWTLDKLISGTDSFLKEVNIIVEDQRLLGEHKPFHYRGDIPKKADLEKIAQHIEERIQGEANEF